MIRRFLSSSLTAASLGFMALALIASGSTPANANNVAVKCQFWQIPGTNTFDCHGDCPLITYMDGSTYQQKCNTAGTPNNLTCGCS
jgi:hypothetical protein